MALSWTMPGTPAADELVAHARAQVPADFAATSRPQEELRALAAQFALAEAQAAEWLRQTRLSYATGAWLRQHGADRGYRPQAGESEDAERARYRTPPSAVTIPAVQAAVDSVLTAAGVAGMARLVEVPVPAGMFVGRDYANRGWRAARKGGGHLVVVVPAGTPAGVQAAVLETVRVKHGAGTSYHLEVAS